MDTHDETSFTADSAAQAPIASKLSHAARTLGDIAHKHPAATVAICALIAVALFACITAINVNASGQRLQQLGQQSVAGYETLKERILSGDAQGASEQAEEIAASSDELAAELARWQWSVVSFLPGIGQDVSTARSLAAENTMLAHEVTVPVAGAWCELSQSNIFNPDGTLDLIALAGKPAAVASLVDTVRNAASVVAECNQRVQALPEGKTRTVRDTVSQAKEVLARVDSAFAGADASLGAVDSIGDTIAGLLP